MSENPQRPRSIVWFILPTLFSIIGGVIAYFVLKNDDPSKAKNCLWLGIILSAFYLAYYVFFGFLIDTYEFT